MQQGWQKLLNAKDLKSVHCQTARNEFKVLIKEPFSLGLKSQTVRRCSWRAGDLLIKGPTFTSTMNPLSLGLNVQNKTSLLNPKISRQM